MTADAELAMDLAASTWYKFRVVCQYNTQATPDFKCDINYTGTTSAYREFATYIVPGSTTLVSTAPHTTLGTDTVITGASGGEGRVEIEGAIQTNGAGTLQFRWAQNTSSGITLVRNGSVLVVYRA